MKQLLVFANLAIISNVYANELTYSQEKSLQKVVQLYGYNCDSVDSEKTYVSGWSGTINFVCKSNVGNYYFYEIKDVGGKLVVTVD